jgi:hypothetical protein
MDPAAAAVNFCRSRGLERVRQGTAADLGAGVFPLCDAVCFFDVLEHLEDDAGALRGAAANLAPGGLVLATVPAYQWLWSPHDVWHHHYRRYTAPRLEALLRAAGFSPVQLGYYNSRLFPLAVAKRMFDRLRGPASPELLPLPVEPVNRAFRRVFASERKRLTGPRPRPFRYGLSVMAVAQKDG